MDKIYIFYTILNHYGIIAQEIKIMNKFIFLFQLGEGASFKVSSFMFRHKGQFKINK